MKQQLIQKVKNSSLEKLVFFDGLKNNDVVTLFLIDLTRPHFFTSEEKKMVGMLFGVKNKTNRLAKLDI